MSLPWFWRWRIRNSPDGEKCRLCWIKKSRLTISYHSCTEETRIKYYERMFDSWPKEVEKPKIQIPPRNEDHCAGITILCKECHNKLILEEQKQVYYYFIHQFWNHEYKNEWHFDACKAWPEIEESLVRNLTR